MQHYYRKGQVNEQGRAICGAKTRSGKPCQGHPMPNGRCRMHGGSSLAGIASPAYKHGRYSKYLPTQVRQKYDTALQDPEFLSLRQEIVLVDVRICDLLLRVDTGEAGVIYVEAQRAYQRAMTAMQAGRKAEYTRAWNDLGKWLGRGQADYAAWREVLKAIEDRHKLVDAERRYLVQAECFLGVDQAIMLADQLVLAVKEVIANPEQLQAIQQAFIRLLSRGGGSHE